MGDFEVDTKGICFACFTEIDKKECDSTTNNNKKLRSHHRFDHAEGEVEEDKDPDTSPAKPNRIISFQNISRHLKLDMSKIFCVETTGIPLQLVKNLEKSNVKVSLCRECYFTTEKASLLAEEFRRVKLELGCLLTTIHKKFLDAEKDEKAKKIYWEKVTSNPQALMHLPIVEKLRKETIEKCSERISNVNPTISLEKIPPKNLMGLTSKKRKPAEESASSSSSDEEENETSVTFPSAKKTRKSLMSTRSSQTKMVTTSQKQKDEDKVYKNKKTSNQESVAKSTGHKKVKVGPKAATARMEATLMWFGKRKRGQGTKIDYREPSSSGESHSESDADSDGNGGIINNKKNDNVAKGKNGNKKVIINDRKMISSPNSSVVLLTSEVNAATATSEPNDVDKAQDIQSVSPSQLEEVQDVNEANNENETICDIDIIPEPVRIVKKTSLEPVQRYKKTVAVSSTTTSVPAHVRKKPNDIPNEFSVIASALVSSSTFAAEKGRAKSKKFDPVKSYWPFKCRICRKRFKTNDQYTIHENNMHRNTFSGELLRSLNNEESDSSTDSSSSSSSSSSDNNAPTTLTSLPRKRKTQMATTSGHARTRSSAPPPPVKSSRPSAGSEKKKDGLFLCSNCPLIFPSKARLAHHTNNEHVNNLSKKRAKIRSQSEGMQGSSTAVESDEESFFRGCNPSVPIPITVEIDNSLDETEADDEGQEVKIEFIMPEPDSIPQLSSDFIEEGGGSGSRDINCSTTTTLIIMGDCNRTELDNTNAGDNINEADNDTKPDELETVRNEYANRNLSHRPKNKTNDKVKESTETNQGDLNIDEATDPLTICVTSLAFGLMNSDEIKTEHTENMEGLVPIALPIDGDGANTSTQN